MKKQIVKIEYPLPFYIPMEEGIKLVTDYQDFASFKFECKKNINPVVKSISEIEDFSTTIIIEFMPSPKFIVSDTEKLMRYAVKHTIIYLNNFLDALRLTYNLNFIKNFSITDLPPIIEIEVNGQKYDYVTTPTTIINNINPLNLSKLTNVQNKISAWDRNNYFEVIDKFLSKGIHHLHTEEYIFAILELQTSFEVYIRMCHNLILLKEGETGTKIEQAKKYAFKNTIVDHIGRYLEEDLDFENNTFINNWYVKLYSLRNKIVHSGYSYVSGDEAYEAFDAMEKVINYITDLMIKKSYIEEGGIIRIEQFDKNTPKHVNKDDVIKRLKDRGFI